MSALFRESQWWIPLSVVLAGFIGSPHCLSMCGPIVANFSRRRSDLLAYQLGRGFAYALVGAMAGGIGETVLGGERPEWLADLSLLLIALLLVVNGYRAVMNKPLHFRLPNFVNRFSTSLWKDLRGAAWPPLVTSSIAGLLTVLLPCGHLYSFLVGAIATGSAVAGAVFMMAFWLGSTPLLSLSGWGLQKFLQTRAPQRQRWAGVILVIAGLFSVLAFGARTDLLGRPLPTPSPEPHHHEQAGRCH